MKIISLFLLISLPVSALEIIHDSGQTVPADPYYEKLKIVYEGAEKAFNNSRNIIPRVPKVDLLTIESHFPLKTSLQPGEFVEIGVQGLTLPVFVIGLDEMSLAWVETYFEELKAMGATGYVVAGEYVDFIRVQSQLSDYGMTVNIAPGDAMAHEYGISTYPALMIGK